ncbi:site-specific integrase [Haloglomus irregulare]|uniref:Site-specific integrase n=1 Tax=Haloglomus irregulare TaxID=2234134 RepID=A0A554MTV7_9EURY|nr:site-specific integrase [Haloglomus irregulare]TSD08562.1 site-specific integrase [Haloglomus irregulare]
MVRIDDSGDETKCWLSYPDEIDALAREARETDWERRIAILLMGKVGLRASGVSTAKPQGLRHNDEGEYWELSVAGKNTKGGDKATRDAYVPESVKRELENYAKERNIAPSEPYVSVSVDSIRRWVREAREPLTDDNERWQHVSSHDLRRSWASHHLVEEDVSVRVMMDIGGWSDYQSIEPYLSKPTPAKIGEELNGLH